MTDDTRLRRIRQTVAEPWDPAAGETTAQFLLRLLDDANARLDASTADLTGRTAEVDNDTRQYGTDGPFRYYEDDHTALVHVLWGSGVVSTTADSVATRILRSRWMAAVRSRAAGVAPLGPDSTMGQR